MNEDWKQFLIIIGFMVVGLVCGFLLAQTLNTENYAASCNKQCTAYMEENCICKTNIVEKPLVMEYRKNMIGEQNEG